MMVHKLLCLCRFPGRSSIDLQLKKIIIIHRRFNYRRYFEVVWLVCKFIFCARRRACVKKMAIFYLFFWEFSGGSYKIIDAAWKKHSQETGGLFDGEIDFLFDGILSD